MSIVDKQMRMKLQGELAYITERLEQIKQNRDEQGQDKYEITMWAKRKEEIMTQLYS
jgi:hypothetical protein